MTSAIGTLLFATILSAAPEPGTLVTYRGTFVAAKGELADSRKSFTVTYLVADADASGLELYWTLQEQGRGGWAWPDRFGQLRLDSDRAPTPDVLPTLLYVRESGKSTIPLHAPVSHRRELAVGAKWEDGSLEFEVTAEKPVAERNAWVAEGRHRYGRNRTLSIDKGNSLILALSETVFIGQGEQHQLEFQLADAKTLRADELAMAVAGFRSLVKLRDELGRTPRDSAPWTDRQLAALRAKLPEAARQVKTGPLLEVAKAAELDTREQNGRAGAVAAMKKKLIGMPLPEVKLEQLSGKPFDRDAWKGQVTVLHFWEYKDMPLEEPYGQSAYLDFLARQHESIKVYGISVDPALRGAETRARSVTSAKKFVAFMNLSYPVLLDRSGAIEELGDPRQTGAELPLVIVLDRSGKVAHYHVGHYEVDRLKGLQELDEVVRKLAAKSE